MPPTPPPFANLPRVRPRVLQDDDESMELSDDDSESDVSGDGDVSDAEVSKDQAPAAPRRQYIR